VHGTICVKHCNKEKIWSHFSGCHNNKQAMVLAIIVLANTGNGTSQYCFTMENTYATIKLQVLLNFLTLASTRKKVSHFIFKNGPLKFIILVASV
jgi:hypothetical protein